jgi:hypothetical protein
MMSRGLRVRAGSAFKTIAAYLAFAVASIVAWSLYAWAVAEDKPAAGVSGSREETLTTGITKLTISATITRLGESAHGDGQGRQPGHRAPGDERHCRLGGPPAPVVGTVRVGVLGHGVLSGET